MVNASFPRLSKLIGCAAMLLAAAGAPLSQLVLVVESQDAAQPATYKLQVAALQARADLKPETRNLKPASKAGLPVAPKKAPAPRLLKPVSDFWDTASAASVASPAVPAAPVALNLFQADPAPAHVSSTPTFTSLALAPPSARGPPHA